MSADGEIEVQVRAEGVDDAAAEMGEAGDGGGLGPLGGGGGGGRGGLAAAIGGGIVGGLLSEAIGPLLKVLDPILNILSAFLAPLAALLLRLLAPVLRFLVQLLPAFMQFISNLPEIVGDVVRFIQALPGMIWNFLSQLPGRIWSFVQGLPSLIWSTFESAIGWATDIGKAIGGWILDKAAWLTNSLGKIAKAIGLAVATAIEQGVSGFTDVATSPPPSFDPLSTARRFREDSTQDDDLTAGEREFINVVFEGGWGDVLTTRERNSSVDR